MAAESHWSPELTKDLNCSWGLHLEVSSDCSGLDLSGLPCALLASFRPAGAISSTASFPFLGFPSLNDAKEGNSHGCVDLAPGSVLHLRPHSHALRRKMRLRGFTCPKLQVVRPEAASAHLSTGDCLMSVGPESLYPPLSPCTPELGRSLAESQAA